MTSATHGKLFYVWVAFILLAGAGATYAECTDRIPCSWYDHSTLRNVPVRCLKGIVP